MDHASILESLNDQQRQAVIASPGPLLITAGAGSGKTTVLTRRVAWLIKVMRVTHHRILVVTFTNKAAREMKERIEGLLSPGSTPLHIGTFHGLSARFLRRHYVEAGLPSSFEILDSDAQKWFVGKLVTDHMIPIRKEKIKPLISYINNCKECAFRAANAPQNFDNDQFPEIYELYEKECNRRGLVDFTELILRTYELLTNNQPVREQIQERFLHVLVDEFQDTNFLQYQWLKSISARHRNITVVGDEDQSIYGWRGALPGNMQQFSSEYAGTKIIRLEQNYRSTQQILSAANGLISQNTDRFEKQLWSGLGSGESLKFHHATVATEEANFVFDRIKHHYESGNRYSEMAVLYRTNAQSEIFEKTLLSREIPYQIYGGQRFYERAEIKHILAYLRLLVDPDNDGAFIRAIENPPRGIGAVTQRKLSNFAMENNLSLWQASKKMITNSMLTPRFTNLLKSFIQTVDKLRRDCAHSELHDIVKMTVDASRLRRYYLDRKNETDLSRVENLDELVSAAADFTTVSPLHMGQQELTSQRLNAVTAYLDVVTLEAGDRHKNSSDDAVQMMTLHSAKGLEFPVVFLTGMSENLLPHFFSIQYGDKTELEEERRLCYVGLTRAMRHLYLTCADMRRQRGEFTYFKTSRFLKEIPPEYIQRIGYTEAESEISAKISENQNSHNILGKNVYHQKFGTGWIIDVDDREETTLVSINFEKEGMKTLVLELANLQFLH